MQKQGIARPTVRPEWAADLFAYFVSARYFERRGDSAPASASSLCVIVPIVTGSRRRWQGAGPSVANWESLADPLSLVQQMWNHGTKMHAAFDARKFAWARLTSQELTA